MIKALSQLRFGTVFVANMLAMKLGIYSPNVTLKKGEVS